MRAPAVLAALLLIAFAARAGDLVVRVTDDHGRAAADAVVTLVEPDAAPARTAPATRVIDQRNETFVPYVETFRPGDLVVFRNSDTTRHHVYSFSPTRTFEYVLRPSESTTPLALDKVGVISVGCNIHDQMLTYLFVSDARFMARTGADGSAHFTDLPPGHYTVGAWHPQLRPGRDVAAQAVVVDAASGAAKTMAFVLALLPDPRLPLDRERSRY